MNILSELQVALQSCGVFVVFNRTSDTKKQFLNVYVSCCFEDQVSVNPVKAQM